MLDSVFETLFTCEVTITGLFLVFLGLYQRLKLSGKRLDTYELSLMALTILIMTVSVFYLGSMLGVQSAGYLGASFSYWNTLVTAGIALVVASLTLVLIQAALVYGWLGRGAVGSATDKDANDVE